MARFPIEYEVELTRGELAPIELKSGARPPTLVGPPPEFGGQDRWWSPEHLLVSAAATCFAMTFFAAGEREGIRVGAYQCRARGILTRAGEMIAFTSIHLFLDVRVTGNDVDRVNKLLDDTKRRCFVANSLRCPVEVTAHVGTS